MNLRFLNQIWNLATTSCVEFLRHSLGYTSKSVVKNLKDIDLPRRRAVIVSYDNERSALDYLESIRDCSEFSVAHIVSEGIVMISVSLTDEELMLMKLSIVVQAAPIWSYE